MKIKVNFEFVYEVNPEHYPEDVRNDAQAMADLDFDADSAGFILANGDDGTLTAVEVK